MITGFIWNVRGCLEKNIEIAKRVREVDIAILVETKSKRTDHFRIPGYNLISHNDYNYGDGGAGRIAIFVKEKFKIEEIERQGKDIKGVEWPGRRLLTKESYRNFQGIYRAPQGTKTVLNGKN